MPIKSSQLKKFSMKQLKDIMRKNGIKGLSGKKGSLIERISNHSSFNTIKESLSLPEKTKRVFSQAQKEAQKRFTESRKKVKPLLDLKIKPIISKIENIKRESVIEDIIEIKDNIKLGSMKEENKILRSIVRLFITDIF